MTEQIVAEPQSEPETYVVPEQNVARLAERIAQLNKRAKRLSVAPIVLTTVGEEVRDYKNFHVHAASEGAVFDAATQRYCRIEKRRYVHVQVSGEAPRINGWTFVATLQHAGEAGTIIRALPGVELPTQYREATPDWCDHCHLRRDRKDTYVVHSDAGEYRQVGSSCLRDFLGHASPQALAAQAQWLADLRLALDESDDDYAGGRSGEENDYLPAFLTTTAHVIRGKGWMSRTKARELYWTGELATADHVQTLRNNAGSKSAEELRQQIGQQTEADEQKAADALQWAREYLAEKDELNDYESNLRIVTAADVVTHRTAGIAASLIPAYERYCEREVRAALERKAATVSEWIGTEGGKIDGLVVTVAGVRVLEGDYGTTQLVTMVDESGNQLKWFNSGSANPEAGHRYTLRGSVKRHGEYNNIRETVVTRCKLVAVPEAVAAA